MQYHGDITITQIEVTGTSVTTSKHHRFSKLIKRYTNSHLYTYGLRILCQTDNNVYGIQPLHKYIMEGTSPWINEQVGCWLCTSGHIASLYFGLDIRFVNHGLLPFLEDIKRANKKVVPIQLLVGVSYTGYTGQTGTDKIVENIRYKMLSLINYLWTYELGNIKGEPMPEVNFTTHVILDPKITVQGITNKIEL